MDVLKLLEDVKNDKVSLEEAAKELKQLPMKILDLPSWITIARSGRVLEKSSSAAVSLMSIC